MWNVGEISVINVTGMIEAKEQEEDQLWLKKGDLFNVFFAKNFGAKHIVIVMGVIRGLRAAPNYYIMCFLVVIVAE